MKGELMKNGKQTESKVTDTDFYNLYFILAYLLHCPRSMMLLVGYIIKWQQFQSIKTPRNVDETK